MVGAMIRLLLAFALLAAVAPAAAAERRYPVSDFDRIVVEGPYQVHLAIGRATTASAEGGMESLDRLTMDVNGRTLRIRRSSTYWGGNPSQQSGPLNINLTTRTLSSARLVGSG